MSNLPDFSQCTYFVLYEEIFLLRPYLECTVCCHLIFLELIKCLRMCNLNALTEDILDILRYNGVMEWSQIIMEWKSSFFCSYHTLSLWVTRNYGKIYEAQRHTYVRGDNIRKAHATPVSAPFCRTPTFSLAAMTLSDFQSP